MRGYLYTYRCWMLIALAVPLALVAGNPVPAISRAQPVVVVDPGHGGTETGAAGQAGIIEKRLALDLAERISERLRGRYRVVLTRTSDVNMPLDERAGRANHEKADAFVSIHAGGSVSRTVEGIGIFYYTGMFTVAPEALPAPDLVAAPPATQPWQRNQIPHRAASSALAHRIRARLEAPPAAAETITVMDGPLRVLKGADMPAVMIEVGYLTNPIEEKRLTDTAHLASLAARISQGIDDFFNTRDTISSTDLKE